MRCTGIWLGLACCGLLAVNQSLPAAAQTPTWDGFTGGGAAVSPGLTESRSPLGPVEAVVPRPESTTTAPPASAEIAVAGVAAPSSGHTGASTPPVPPPMFPAGPSLAAAGDMIGFSRELAGGTQAITLISASRRWMAVYHIDPAGQIRLVSSRPLDDDFSIQFNATAPLPEEIRRLKAR